MKINKETVMQYRIKHPNCLYCQHLAKDRYILYYCNAKKKSFLLGNRIKAKRCSLYAPQENDLDIATLAFDLAVEEGVVKLDI